MLYSAVAAVAFIAVANAQSAPDWKLFPKACATACAKTIETSYLCQNEFQGGTAIYGCFCEAYPTDAAGCADCLGKNDAAALGQLLTGTQTDCGAQQKNCAFSCAFDTCAPSDVACQCSETYLSAIFNCASCNEATGHAGTKLADFTALKDSCGAQSFAGASQSFVTWVNAPTGAAAYTAPELTATGGGEAATGTFLPAAEQTVPAAAPTAAAPAANTPAANAPAANTPAANTPVASRPAGAVASVASGAAGAVSGAVSAVAGAASGAVSAVAGAASGAASAVTPGSGASRVGAPAAVIAAVAGVVALF